MLCAHLPRREELRSTHETDYLQPSGKERSLRGIPAFPPRRIHTPVQIIQISFFLHNMHEVVILQLEFASLNYLHFDASTQFALHRSFDRVDVRDRASNFEFRRRTLPVHRRPGALRQSW